MSKDKSRRYGYSIGRIVTTDDGAAIEDETTLKRVAGFKTESAVMNYAKSVKLRANQFFRINRPETEKAKS